MGVGCIGNPAHLHRSGEVKSYKLFLLNQELGKARGGGDMSGQGSAQLGFVPVLGRNERKAKKEG